MVLALFFLVPCVHSQVALPEDAREKLAAARRMARISEASREVIEEKLEALEAEENPSPGNIAKYQDYLKRVQEFERKQQRVLDEMEALYAPFASDGEPLLSSTNRGHDVFAVSIPRDDDSDRLEREFKQSLESLDGEFLNKLDELAEEMEELEEDAASESSELAAAIEAAQQRLEQIESDPSEGAGGGMEGESAQGSGSGDAGGPDQAHPADRGGEGGGEMASDNIGQGAEKELSGDGSSTGDQTEGDLGEGGEMGASASGNGDERFVPSGGGLGSAEIPDGSNRAPPEDPAMNSRDDDIISRQLREAAEKETDPELKEKLWTEYRRYKGSSTH